MKRSRKFLALALLVPTLITAACGSGGEQEETAETGAETTETADLETIGAGTDVTEEPDDPEEDSSTETVEKPEATDFSFIEGGITSVEEDKTELTLIIAHHMKEAKSVEFTYQEVLLDGATAENWEAHGRGADTFTIDPNAFQSFPQTLVLSTNIDNYSELTVNAIANFDDGTETYPFSATFQTSEMERKIDEKAVAASKEIYVEEQELYNDNGFIITVTGMDVARGDSVNLQLSFTNNRAGEIGFSPAIKELYIGDTLVEKKDMEMMFFEGKGVIYIPGEDISKRIEEELPEISLVFEFRTEVGGELVQTPKLTFPVLSK